MQRNFAAAILSVVLIVLVAVVAAAQGGPLAGLAQPIVVNIEQAVPVDITLALPQADGSVITTTAPITVGVSLQIKLDGAQIVAVTVPAADAQPTPVIAIVRPTPVPVVSGAAPVYDSVSWQLEKAENVGAVFDDPDDNWKAEETKGAFVVTDFTVENVGSDPAQIHYGATYAYQLMLQDGAGRRFQPFDGYYGDPCYYVDLNPGLPKDCRVLFEVPTDATELSLVFIDDAGETAIPLGF